MRADVCEKLRVLGHDCVRLETEERVIYTDPFKLEEAPKDGDLIFVTHDHYDHLSPEDLEKVAGPGAQVILPEGCDVSKLPESVAGVFFVKPGEQYEVDGIRFATVPAYNIGKAFHPLENGWVGYVIEANGYKYYLAGDTDRTPEAEAVECDLALLPVGGTFTMTAEEAAGLASVMKADCFVPVHYAVIVGSSDDADRFCELVGGKAAILF